MVGRGTRRPGGLGRAGSVLDSPPESCEVTSVQRNKPTARPTLSRGRPGCPRCSLSPGQNAVPQALSSTSTQAVTKIHVPWAALSDEAGATNVPGSEGTCPVSHRHELSLCLSGRPPRQLSKTPRPDLAHHSGHWAACSREGLGPPLPQSSLWLWQPPQVKVEGTAGRGSKARTSMWRQGG